MKTVRHITAGFLLLAALAACGTPAIKDYGHGEGATSDHGPATQAAEGGAHAEGPATKAAEAAPATQPAPAAAATAAATAAAAPAQAAKIASVTGRVNFTARTPLPTGAVMVIRIEDVAAPDKASAALGEQRIILDGRTAPVSIAVAYDASQVKAETRYAVSINIQDTSGKVLFLNTTMQPVITQGAKADIGEVTLSAVN